MPFNEIAYPVPGVKAFSETGDDAILSQAALLLLIGSQLRGDQTRLRRLPLDATRSPGSGATETEEDEENALQLPKLNLVTGRTDAVRLRQLLYSRYNLKEVPEPQIAEAQVERPDILNDVAGRFFREPSANTAFDLLEFSLVHPNEMVRVAASAAYMEHSSEKQRLLRILETGLRSTEPLIRNVAATALAHESPTHPLLQELLGGRRSAGAAGAADTTMIIHGTWAANAVWWQPTGDFHAYILNSVRPDLYSKNDRFAWSGGYSDPARANAARDLIVWVNSRGEQGLDLITHSHGGNVVFLATTLSPALQTGELILLSCPVHFPKYSPNFSQITKKIVSVRVHMDLVILADRGGQRFLIPQISENVLGIWFDHSATHDPDVWKKHNLPAKI